MAKSRFEYVKQFERPDGLLPNVWLVVRVDGRGFHKFTDRHDFSKPNDVRGLQLMNHAAKACLEEFGDIVLAYGQSDEYSFVFRKEMNLFGRRASKITTAVVSCFTANYVLGWPQIMVSEQGKEMPLQCAPQFDGRIVEYPSLENIRDYLSWRQADCHINNLYNTTFWTLVHRDSKSEQEAEGVLKDTLSADKNEILFKFGINYNNEPAMFRKGSVLLRQEVKQQTEGADAAQAKVVVAVVVVHEDMIGDEFWQTHSDIFPSDGAQASDSRRKKKQQARQEEKEVKRQQHKQRERESKAAAAAAATSEPADD